INDLIVLFQSRDRDVWRSNESKVRVLLSLCLSAGDDGLPDPGLVERDLVTVYHQVLIHVTAAVVIFDASLVPILSFVSVSQIAPVDLGPSADLGVALLLQQLRRVSPDGFGG